MRYYSSLLIVLLVAGVLVSGFPVSVHGRTVSPGESIQAAINAAVANETITVLAGTFIERVVVNRTVHLVGAGIGSSIIDGGALGNAVVRITASGASIAGFTVQDSGPGGRAVRVFRADNVSITGNGISSDVSSGRLTGAGVEIELSNRTIVDGNVFSNNYWAVNMSRSHDVQVTNNQIVSMNVVSVEVRDCWRSIVGRNTLEGFSEGVDMNGGLTVNNSITRNLVRAMNISGVFLLDGPTGNVFSENSFELNHVGVTVQNSPGNTFFHNSFLARSVGGVKPRHVNSIFPGDVSVWDNRSLGNVRVGGNYWDNYTGYDDDHNGIGDTPFRIDAYNLDQYPLMSPFVPVPVYIASVSVSVLSGVVPLNVSFGVDVLGSLKPFVYTWDFGDGSGKSNSSSPYHVYSRVGGFVASVFVKDASGASSLKTVTVTVLPVVIDGFWAGFWPYLVVLIVAGVGLGLFLLRRRRRLKDGGVSVEESSSKRMRVRKG